MAVGIILAVFVVSFIHVPDPKERPSLCVHARLLGKKCPTCGLMDGFSSIVRGRFGPARGYQSNSEVTFVFMVVQLFIRILVILLLYRTRISAKIIYNIDLTLFMVLFIVLFRTIIFQSAYIIYKMMLTGQ
jgi:hypothetical protein